MAPRKLGPGIYADGDTLHVDAAELCAAAGYEPTPENLDTLERAARQLAADAGASFSLDPPRSTP